MEQVTMTMFLQDSDGELVLILDEPLTERYPQRRALRYFTRELAAVHMNSLGLWSAESIQALLSVDFRGEVFSVPVVVPEPKVTLRGLMPYPITLLQ